MGDGDRQNRSFMGFKRLLGDESNPTGGILVDSDSKTLHIVDPADANTDWDVSAAMHPTVAIHGATTPATEYVQIYTDETDAHLNVKGTAGLDIDVPASQKVSVQVNDSDILTVNGTMVVANATTLCKHTQTALVGTATVTAAQLLTLVLDGTPTAAATYTLPTAALLVAAIPNVAVGSSFYFIVNNKSAGANTITVAAGDGGTADGTLTIAQNVIRGFFVIITNVATPAYFVYGLGA